jgi:hypothetical protein
MNQKKLFVMKLRKNFSFTYSLTKKVVRDLKIVTEKLPLIVSVVGYQDTSASTLEPLERWTVDIEAVHYEEKNILEVLDFSGTLEQIEEAAIRYAAELFTENVAA